MNRNAVISLGLARGFNAFLPVYDDGIDFILHSEAEGLLRKVQLKSRWTIDHKYTGRDIWIAFPIQAEWYLMPHDTMLELARRFGITDTGSWRDRGIYSKPRPSKELIAACAPWQFGPGRCCRGRDGTVRN
ncbi:hypothetical protein E6W36_05040 [Hankyongella ginsenosidimutans]|uniref:PD(D/E)XK endonuclease domain-containing protein n=1 Tax=Hankyongella ginsenosidimutans TaxID=1763828 RepID=A0A4D7C0B5_9SPHN|nr:hypothetical protein [Hankyongella ginsenosidimutans]QCI79154.1 hypothetical protein E6W36_05040 [Hankyongella ginsenosidimutans]